MVRGSAGRMHPIKELFCYGAELQAPFYLALPVEVVEKGSVRNDIFPSDFPHAIYE